MRRIVLVCGASSTSDQNKVTKAIRAEGVAWWHHMSNLWLILDRTDEGPDYWARLARKAAKVSVLAFDADGERPGEQLPWSFLNEKAHPWLLGAWQEAKRRR